MCWFRPTARKHINRIWDIVALLENNGVATRMLVTRRPGYVVYEDEYQVCAEPFMRERRR